MDVDIQLAEPGDPGDWPDGWLAERKLDGVRAVAVDGHLRTRSGRDVTANFLEVDVPNEIALDGELVTADFQFSSIMRRVQLEDTFQIELLADRMPAYFVVFDRPDLGDEPLRDRYDALDVEDLDHVVPITQGDPADLWEQAAEEGWEGIMLKAPDATYTDGRTDDWRKIKRWQDDEFELLGHERTDNDGFVALVDVGDDEPQKVVANGQDQQAAIQNGAHAIEVQFLERTDEGRLRKPSLKRVVG